MRTYTIRYRAPQIEGSIFLSARDEEQARARAAASLRLRDPRLDLSSVSFEVVEFVRGVA